ncbi:MAG: PL29 family lyase N-terminal domain-containing protein [Alistipes sp.]
MWSCTDEYDDTAIWREIDDLKAKIAELNRQMTTLRHALDEGCVITSVEPTAEGFLITFSNGETITVKHGSAGDASRSACGRRMACFTGRSTTNSCCVPAAGAIPVRGGDESRQTGTACARAGGRCEGYWTVDGTRVEDATGAESKHRAIPSSRIEQTDDAVSLILARRSTITIPKAADSSLVFDTKACSSRRTDRRPSPTARNLAFVELFSVSKDGCQPREQARHGNRYRTGRCDSRTGVSSSRAHASGRTYMAAVQLYCERCRRRILRL